MDSKNFAPGDPDFINKIVEEYMSQGQFDNMRRRLMVDLDTKSSYQNVRQRIESTVQSFLNKQRWRPGLIKNQLRDNLKRQIINAPFLRPGVTRIVEQLANRSSMVELRPDLETVAKGILGITDPPEPEPMDTLPDDSNPARSPSESEMVIVEQDETNEEIRPDEDSTLDGKLAVAMDDLKIPTANSAETTEGEETRDTSNGEVSENQEKMEAMAVDDSVEQDSMTEPTDESEHAIISQMSPISAGTPSPPPSPLRESGLAPTKRASQFIGKIPKKKADNDDQKKEEEKNGVEEQKRENSRDLDKNRPKDRRREKSSERSSVRDKSNRDDDKNRKESDKKRESNRSKDRDYDRDRSKDKYSSRDRDRSRKDDKSRDRKESERSQRDNKEDARSPSKDGKRSEKGQRDRENDRNNRDRKESDRSHRDSESAKRSKSSESSRKESDRSQRENKDSEKSKRDARDGRDSRTGERNDRDRKDNRGNYDKKYSDGKGRSSSDKKREGRDRDRSRDRSKRSADGSRVHDDEKYDSTSKLEGSGSRVEDENSRTDVLTNSTIEKRKSDQGDSKSNDRSKRNKGHSSRRSQERDESRQESSESKARVETINDGDDGNSRMDFGESDVQATEKKSPATINYDSNSQSQTESLADKAEDNQGTENFRPTTPDNTSMDSQGSREQLPPRYKIGTISPILTRSKGRKSVDLPTAPGTRSKKKPGKKVR